MIKESSSRRITLGLEKAVEAERSSRREREAEGAEMWFDMTLYKDWIFGMFFLARFSSEGAVGFVLYVFYFFGGKLDRRRRIKKGEIFLNLIAPSSRKGICLFPSTCNPSADPCEPNNIPQSPFQSNSIQSLPPCSIYLQLPHSENLTTAHNSPESSPSSPDNSLPTNHPHSPSCESP